jgi:hypothetical protein
MDGKNVVIIQGFKEYGGRGSTGREKHVQSRPGERRRLSGLRIVLMMGPEPQTLREAIG